MRSLGGKREIVALRNTCAEIQAALEESRNRSEQVVMLYFADQKTNPEVLRMMEKLKRVWSKWKEEMGFIGEDAQDVKAEIEPEIGGKEPGQRFRAPGTSTASPAATKAAESDTLTKDPVRRGP